MFIQVSLAKCLITLCIINSAKAQNDKYHNLSFSCAVTECCRWYTWMPALVGWGCHLMHYGHCRFSQGGLVLGVLGCRMLYQETAVWRLAGYLKNQVPPERTWEAGHLKSLPSPDVLHQKLSHCVPWANMVVLLRAIAEDLIGLLLKMLKKLVFHHSEEPHSSQSTCWLLMQLVLCCC